MSISRTQVRNSLIMILDIVRKPTVIAQIWASRNCLWQLYFKSKWRGIGYSFQLAITAPLYSITGYCITTAQSYSKLNDDLIYWDFTIQFLLQNYLSIPNRGWVFFFLITKVRCNSTEDNLLRGNPVSITTKLLIAWFTSTRGVYQFRTVKPVHFFRAKESLLIHLIHDLCMPVSDSNHSWYIITTLCWLFEWQREDKQESKSLIIRG